jgi:hypothetical protein
VIDGDHELGTLRYVPVIERGFRTAVLPGVSSDQQPEHLFGGKRTLSDRVRHGAILQSASLGVPFTHLMNHNTFFEK